MFGPRGWVFSDTSTVSTNGSTTTTTATTTTENGNNQQGETNFRTNYWLILTTLSSFVADLALLFVKGASQYVVASFAAFMGGLSIYLMLVKYARRGKEKGGLLTRRGGIFLFVAKEDGTRVWYAPTLLETVSFIFCMGYVATSLCDVLVRVRSWHTIVGGITPFSTTLAAGVLVVVLIDEISYIFG